MEMAKVIVSFDVDNTLDISDGPIPSERVRQLKEAGFIVGFNGNYELARRFLGDGFDFYECGKAETLLRLNRLYPDAVLRIHVGDSPIDQEAARLAGWIYVRPEDFR